MPKRKRDKHVHFEMVIRGSAPSKEAQKLAREIAQKIAMLKRKYYPDTTVGLGKLV